MPLIVSSILHRGWSLRRDLSSIHIYVDKKYLSQQYELTYFLNEYWVYGNIIDVQRVYGSLSSTEKEVFEKHVIGRNVKLFLVPGILIINDSLYFDNESWSILRDAGVVPDEYRVKMKLIKVEIKEASGFRELDLYPYRDIVAPEA